ncbi:MAG: ribosomal protein S18-alanine N-acetyltransferase [Aridibacter sp.]
MRIVEMKPEDVLTIKNIEIQNGLAEWKIEDYLNAIKKNDHFTKIIKFENEIIGFIIARLITIETERKYNTAEIYNIAIEKKHGKKGFGGLLLNNLFDNCRESDISEIWLEVRKSNITAHGFYIKHGFEQISERKNYYKHPVESAIIMKREL